MLDSSNNHGVFEFRPLEPGYGITVGNAIRRVLIGSLEGYAICSIKINGIDHEFATIPGVITDVTNLILNLKQVRFARKEGMEVTEETIRMHVKGNTVLLAGELNSYLQAFDVLNPELLLAEMDETADFEIEININKGRGYVSADENRQANDEIGVLAIDSIYTPIVNVKYSIDPCRVEQRTDYEKLTLEISTDGSILPKDALTEAAKLLIYHFMLFSEERIIIEDHAKPATNTFDEEHLRMRQLLNQRLVDMDLSVRALNCLKAAEVDTLGQLVKYHRSDLLKFRNFGKKSLTELDELLEKNGLAFGMDISRYKLND
jgi:DNA-directed RNA polymerase subunit alpha